MKKKIRRQQNITEREASFSDATSYTLYLISTVT